MPQAKIGNNMFVYLYSTNSKNYFSISTVTSIPWNVGTTVSPGMTVQQAYNIDSKIDDGLPQSGNVTACYENFYILGGGTSWAAGLGTGGNNQGYGGTNCVPSTGEAWYYPQNCYDNNNTVGATQQYSFSKNAAQPNCALSFKLQ